MELHDSIAREIAERIRTVGGARAVVLGGSRARGTHTATSDIDLGIYYRLNQPLDIPALDRVAARFDDGHRTGLVTPIGGWGPWINGGGWLTVRSVPVDFLYRDASRVEDVIASCRRGRIEVSYQPGHPHGFVSAIYMAEAAWCRPLWETDNLVSALKESTRPYPPELKKTVIGQFRWEMNFSLATAKKSTERADVVYAAGCVFRCVACLLQILFALNECYWMNEKGALALAAEFPILPPRFRKRVERIFGSLAASMKAITKTLDEMAVLVSETENLTEGI